MQWWRHLSGGRGILLLLALLLLVGGLLFYASEKNPSDVPNPSATAAPDVLVPSSTPPAPSR